MGVLERVLAYSVLPLALAAAQVLLDRQARPPARRVEVVLLYVFAIGVGAGGLGGGFGHLFLADLVAAAIGWPPGSPFQREMAFANLALGVLGVGALRQRDGFRTATVLATAVLGLGATVVHLMDVAATGNLAPGNTVQNLGNVLDPVVLALLLRTARRLPGAEAETPAFARWQGQQARTAGLSAAGVGTGFGLGFAVGAPLALSAAGALLGAALGLVLSRRTRSAWATKSAT